MLIINFMIYVTPRGEGGGGILNKDESRDDIIVSVIECFLRSFWSKADREDS